MQFLVGCIVLIIITALDQPHQLLLSPTSIYVVPRAPQDTSGNKYIYV
jgi:hypothetical protein